MVLHGQFLFAAPAHGIDNADSRLRWNDEGAEMRLVLNGNRW